MSELPSTENLTSALNSTFNLTLSEKNIDFKLTEVTIKETKGSEEYENISMIFCSKEEIPQATYTLHHNSIGSQDLFLVPVGVKEETFEYEVIINRKK